MSIQDTRRGYHYQDKYALLVFLRLLRTGTLSKFYADYSLPPSLSSLDIRAVLSDGSVEIYEIKTGLVVKENRNNSFLISLISLLDSLNIGGERVTRAYLVADPSFKPQVLAFWAEIEFIRLHGASGRTQLRNGTTSRTPKQVAQQLYDQIIALSRRLESPVRDIDLSRFVELMRRIELKDGPEYSLESNSYLDSPAEILISAEIDFFAVQAQCQATGSAEFENKDIISVLLEVVRMGAEKNSDISVSGQNKLIDCLTKRAVIAMRGLENDGQVEEQLSEKRREIEGRITGVSNIRNAEVQVLAAPVMREGNPVT